MNFDCNTSLAGQYTLYDEKKKVLGETENLITDWGMRRFVGDRSTGAPHPEDTDSSQLAFVNNMRYIMLGTGSTGYGSESYSNFKLVSAISPSEYTERNVEATTGTMLSTDPLNGDQLITFTRLTRFEMASSFNSIAAPLSTYAINEIGCSWSQTFSADNRYGIFSRATLNTPIIIKPSNVVYAKYVLTVKTDANQVKSSMTRFNGTGAVNLPANKTNVRDLPLYTLKTDGTPAQIINTGSCNYAHSHPLFEDAGNNNLTYSPGGHAHVCSDHNVTVYGTPGRKKLWWLQFYTSDWPTTNGINGGSNPATRYNTFVSTTSSNLNIAAGMSQRTDGWGVYGSRPSTYEAITTANLSPLVIGSTYSGRKKHESDILRKTNSNTWLRTVRFLFSPNELKQKTTVFNLYKQSVGAWEHWSSIVYVPIDAEASYTYGVVTALSGEYNPNPALYDGFEYNFTYSRA